MAFADPQSITVGSATHALPRTSSGVDTGSFTSPARDVGLTISHSYGKRNRSTIKLDHAKIAADPMTAANTKYTMRAYMVIDTPPTGYTVAEAKEVVTALVNYLSASTGASVTKILGGES